MKWIVTGYSGKEVGLLYCVEAEDERAAVLKVAEISKIQFRQLACDGELHYVLVGNEAYTDDEIVGMIYEGSSRYFWEMRVQPLTENRNMKKAVCW